MYRKNSKNWDTWNNYYNCPTTGTVGFYSAVLCSKDANRITNREDPDQTAPWGAVWSGSANYMYRKNSKNWDTWNNYYNCPTTGTVGFYSAVLCSKDANRITNREDPDQTAPWGAVWSGSALFAQIYLSQYLKLLRYYLIYTHYYYSYLMCHLVSRWVDICRSKFHTRLSALCVMCKI